MAGNNKKPANSEENAVFGAEPQVQSPTTPETPITNQNVPKGGEETVSIPASTFKEILERLNQLETKEVSATRESESDIFDPLKAFTGDRMCRVSFVYNEETGHNDLVLGYRGRKQANGTEQLVWIKKDPITGELRGKCDVIFVNTETGKQYIKEDLDHFAFLETIVTREVPIKNRKDVGQQVKQDFTVQRMWNGRTLAPTATRVQTGYISQKFEFDVEIDGKIYHLLENVINIR